ncbi:MAG: diguanylate cyclase [Hyphomonadaceae bacterium]|nr:diguanylate cyclase [Hyphomonadaceae bacterium]
MSFWRYFQQQASHAAPGPERLWLRYLLALGLILALILFSHIFSMETLRRAETDAEIINKSGRQRMLSQRILYFTDRYTETLDPADMYTATQALDLFQTSHRELTRLAGEDMQMRNIYLDEKPALDDLTQDFAVIAREILSEPTGNPDELAKLHTVGAGLLLSRLDDAVSGFEAMARRKTSRLILIQEASLLAAILVILFEAVVIFRPACRAVRSSLTELREEIKRREAAMQRLTRFSSMAADLFWESDLEGRLTYAEGRFLSQMQGRREDIVGCRYLDLISMDEEMRVAMHESFAGLRSYEGVQATFIDLDGTAFVLELAGTPRFSPQGDLLGYLGTADDVTSRVEELEETRRLAMSDALTGLANKRAFEAGLDTALDGRGTGFSLYVMALDLDGFKPINDTYGHGAGDEVLKIVAARLSASLRAGDWAARTGGDEFFLVCPGIECDEDAAQLARRVIGGVSQTCRLSNGRTVRVATSIGVAATGLQIRDRDSLVEAADRALYAAKRGGRGTVCFAGSEGADWPDLRQWAG